VVDALSWAVLSLHAATDRIRTAAVATDAIFDDVIFDKVRLMLRLMVFLPPGCGAHPLR
jgi:hypothetical protein